MSRPESDKVFTGSIPTLYESYLVPLIFEPYATNLVNRLASRPLDRVLEIAAAPVSSRAASHPFSPTASPSSPRT